MRQPDEVADLVNIPVIASGGAGCPDDFYEALTRGKRMPYWLPEFFISGRFDSGVEMFFERKRYCGSIKYLMKW